MLSDKLFSKARLVLGLSFAKWEGHKVKSRCPPVHHLLCSRSYRGGVAGCLLSSAPVHRFLTGPVLTL